MFQEKEKNLLTSSLHEIIEPILEDDGIELVEIQISGLGKRRILRIFIDSENGVTVDDCARMSEEISVHLEINNPIEGPYFLEVSSPGLDRPLNKDRDYRRCIGKKLRLVFKRDNDTTHELDGKLLQFEKGILTIKNGKDKLHEIPVVEIDQAKIQF